MNHCCEHVYIHVPFCETKCHYCSFYSRIQKDGHVQGYLEALRLEINELKRSGMNFVPQTLFIGGGTPTLLPEAGLSDLCELVAAELSTDVGEWTVEANPSTLTTDKLDILQQAGVNRLSFGVQSFDPHVLEQAGRQHSAQRAINAILDAQSLGFENIGLDLIAGLPGDRPDAWERTLDQALSLDTQHLSVYELSIEEGTVYDRLAKQGRLVRPDISETEAALTMARSRFERCGYLHYETSNFSLPGSQCQHNLSCWRGEDYVGLGPGACSRVDRQRWTNRASLPAYIDKARNENIFEREREELTDEGDATERLVFAFRTLEGVDLNHYARNENRRLSHWTTTMNRISSYGLAETRDGRWFLTESGRPLADRIASEFLL